MISIFGCADVVITKKYTHKFGIGSIAYIRIQATLRGKLEAVSIKKVNRVFPPSPTCGGDQPSFKYIDTLNAIFSESELVWQSEAVDLATAYWEGIKAEADALIKEGCFSPPTDC